jgi:hypothetical protein
VIRKACVGVAREFEELSSLCEVENNIAARLWASRQYRGPDLTGRRGSFTRSSLLCCYRPDSQRWRNFTVTHSHIYDFSPLSARRYCIALVTRARRDESRRTIPKCPGKHQWLHLALAGLPNDMKVKADPKTGVVENTVDELRARTTWPPGLVITTPRKLHLRSVVKIVKAT